MNKLALPLFAALLLLAGINSASAASPAYCALYARELSKEFVRTSANTAGTATEQLIQDQAFYKCLNMDEDPQLPEASAYADVADDGGVGGPFVDAAGGDTAAAVEPAQRPAAKPAAKPKPTAKVASSAPAKRGTNGLEPFTPEWRAWCAKHYPNSFDPNTGYVIPVDGPKRLCPSG